MNFSRRQFLKSLGATATAVVSAPLPGRAEKSLPNILIILADDMGYSDAGCYGGEIDTPHIDRLARDGVRFTQFYNCARCCPTRASLLTGLYPHQVGIARNGRTLTHDGVTIAEVLKSAGYQTAMVGKWHLSITAELQDKKLQQKWLDHQYDPGQPFAPIQSYPVSRGFDKHYGVIWGVIDYFDPFSLVEGKKKVDAVANDFYFTDAITDKAIQYIREFSQNEKPFFLYFAQCAPHWPLHALPEDIEKYRGVYNGGWEQLRRDRFARQLKMGLADEKTFKLPPVQDGGVKWKELSDREKDYHAKKMQVHAAMVDRVDQSIGRVIETLEETAQLENTVIFFLSDNGASPEIVRTPGFDRSSSTRDGRKIYYEGELRKMDNPPLGSETSYTGIGPAWANAANTPFRYWKKESFEGGVHTPFIVHWPAGIAKKAARRIDEPGHVIDIMPTCLELAGAEYPSAFRGHQLLPLEGKSLLPLLRDREWAGHEVLYFEHMGGRAIRVGDWKLVALKGRAWELYHLAEDRTEMNNVADLYPDKMAEMVAMWNQWARRVKVPSPPGR